MAEDNDSASKTEEPSQRKLDEARRAGDVAKSMDLPSAASLAAAFGAVAISGSWMCRNLVTSLTPFLAHADAMPMTRDGSMWVAHAAVRAGTPAVLAVLLSAAAAGVAGNLIQTGFLFSPGKLAPDPKKLSPMENAGRMFGPDAWVQFLKSLLKIGVTGAVAFMVLRPHWAVLSGMTGMDVGQIGPLIVRLVSALFAAVLAFLVAAAGGDWLWQRFRFMSKMRMSKEEMKEEFRQSEGDPHVRARQKQIRAERSKRRMMQNVPKATVVVMNPTHYAVALRYEQGETAAPVCVAKGLDAVALKIREVAEEAGVAVIEDPPLARALYSAVEIDQPIPAAHYEAVAKVISFILGRARKAQARRAPRLALN